MHRKYTQKVHMHGQTDKQMDNMYNTYIHTQYTYTVYKQSTHAWMDGQTDRQKSEYNSIHNINNVNAPYTHNTNTLYNT